MHPGAEVLFLLYCLVSLRHTVWYHCVSLGEVSSASFLSTRSWCHIEAPPQLCTLLSPLLLLIHSGHFPLLPVRRECVIRCTFPEPLEVSKITVQLLSLDYVAPYMNLLSLLAPWHPFDVKSLLFHPRDLLNNHELPLLPCWIGPDPVQVPYSFPGISLCCNLLIAWSDFACTLHLLPVWTSICVLLNSWPPLNSICTQYWQTLEEAAESYQRPESERRPFPNIQAATPSILQAADRRSFRLSETILCTDVWIVVCNWQQFIWTQSSSTVQVSLPEVWYFLMNSWWLGWHSPTVALLRSGTSKIG